MKPRGRPFEKGRKKTGGRKKGTPNLINVDVRELIWRGLCALRGGGEEGFQQFVQEMAERGGAEALGLVKLVTSPTPQTVAVMQKEEQYKT
jgi:hypothetical protein